DSWNTLLGALKTRIEAGEGGAGAPLNLSVGIDATTRQITLTAGTSAKAFQPSASIVYGAYDQASADVYGYQVGVLGATSAAPLVLSDPTVRGTGDELEVRYIAGTDGLATGSTTVTQVGAFATGGGVQSNTQTVSVQAGTATRQVSVVAFPRDLGPGVTYSLAVNGTSYSVVPGQGGLSASATWSDVLAEFKRLIDAGGVVTATTAPATRELTLTAVATNTAFTVGSLRVAAGTGGFQVNDLAFAGATPGASAEVAVVLNGTRYATQVGTNALLEIDGVAATSVRLTSAPVALTVGDTRTQAVDFSGLDLTGLTDVSLTVGSVAPYSVAIGFGNPANTAALAAALAGLVNGATGSTGYSASVSGDVLTVSHASASTIIASVTKTTPGSTSAIAASAVSRSIDLSALTVQQGLTYSVTIGSDVFRHTVTAATTPAELATALAALIDASASYVASAGGSPVITVSSGAGTSSISVAAASSL
ncbi:MAG: hypothetical protein EBU70_12510, partial [Actinobacteria bacterium]|nr:hypothetical protein [Actinomycetota bacterium]